MSKPRNDKSITADAIASILHGHRALCNRRINGIRIGDLLATLREYVRNSPEAEPAKPVVATLPPELTDCELAMTACHVRGPFEHRNWQRELDYPNLVNTDSAHTWKRIAQSGNVSVAYDCRHGWFAILANNECCRAIRELCTPQLVVIRGTTYLICEPSVKTSWKLAAGGRIPYIWTGADVAVKASGT